MLSLSDTLDYAIYLRYIVMELTALEKGEVPISAYVDNKSVVDALHSTKAVEDKRLRIDIGAIKQLMKCKEVASIQWIPGKMMLANVLTKRGAAWFDILELLQSGSFNLHRWNQFSKTRTFVLTIHGLLCFYNKYSHLKKKNKKNMGVLIMLLRIFYFILSL